MSTSWGTILNAGQHTMDTAWWVAVRAGLMLFFTVLSLISSGTACVTLLIPRPFIDLKNGVNVWLCRQRYWKLTT